MGIVVVTYKIPNPLDASPVPRQRNAPAILESATGERCSLLYSAGHGVALRRTEIY
jgi:hypothetical protein